MKLIVFLPRPEVLVYTRPEAARAMHYALPWYYIRYLDTGKTNLLARLLVRLGVPVIRGHGPTRRIVRTVTP